MIIDIIEEFFIIIAEKIGLKKLADWYRAHREGMRYLVFGALSTVLNIVVFELFLKIIGASKNTKLIELSVIISNTIAWIVAVLFAYVTNKLYVFNSKAKNKKDLAREIISFFSARVVTLVIETVFLWVVIDKLGFNKIFMKIISNIIVIILNFVFSKIFIFKKDEKNSSVRL